MSYRSFLDVDIVKAFVPMAREIGVSEAARSKRGFVAAYTAAGKHEVLGEDWKARRSQVLERHASDAGNLWHGGVPTRQHLMLIMWAYSPTPERLVRFLEARKKAAASQAEG